MDQDLSSDPRAHSQWARLVREHRCHLRMAERLAYHARYRASTVVIYIPGRSTHAYAGLAGWADPALGPLAGDPRCRHCQERAVEMERYRARMER